MWGWAVCDSLQLVGTMVMKHGLRGVLRWDQETVWGGVEEAKGGLVASTLALRGGETGKK